MSEIIDTLHKKNDLTVDVYPNIKSENIPTGAVTTDKLDNEAVTTAKIKDDAVKTAKINDGAVTGNKIATETIISDNIGDNQVTTAKLDDEAVTTAKIKDDAVTTAKINNDAVTSDKLANDSVITDKIADGNVTYDKLDNALQNLINTLGIKRHQMIVVFKDANNVSSGYVINFLSLVTEAPTTMNEVLNLLKNSGCQYQPFIRTSNDTIAYINDFDIGNDEIQIYEDRTNSGTLSDYYYTTLVSVTDDILPF